MGAFKLIVIAGWVAFWLYWFISAIQNRTINKRKESFQSRWVSWFFLILAFWLIINNHSAFDWISERFIPATVALRSMGIVVMFSGLSFAVWARIHLGQYWSGRVTIKVDHRLIRTGPYKIVRNPIYTGILFGFIGTALVIGEIRVFLAIALILVGIWLKIKAEEKFLLDEFGQQFLQYKKEVKMLIPYII